MISVMQVERRDRHTLMIPGQLGPISLVLFCRTNLCFTCAGRARLVTTVVCHSDLN